MTGTRTTSGACGSIRDEAKDLTRVRHVTAYFRNKVAFEGVTKLLHGCRQLVPWGVGLSARTSATPIQCYISLETAPLFLSFICYDRRMYYVYVLKSQKTKRFYIGYTSDLKQRVLDHNIGEMATKYGIPWKLIYYEAYLISFKDPA